MKKDKRFYGTAVLLTIFGLSTWLDVNGVWVELPLIVNEAPEGWALPSNLTLAIALSNIGPIILMLLKAIFKQRLNERIFIYVEIIVGIVSCALIAEFWKKRTYIAGQDRSLVFLILVFLLGTLDTTSTVTYADYMKRYDSMLLNALFLGESLTSLLPSILATAQGVGGEPICRENSTYPEYTPARFSVRVYFWIFVGIIVASLIAFIFLEYARLPDPFRVRSEELNRTVENVNQSMNTQLYRLFLLIAFVSSIILFGVLPSIGTYAILPYSQRAYYISSLILPISNPLSVILGLFVSSSLNICLIIGMLILSTGSSIYVLVVAFLSPCPPLHDTVSGAVLVVACYFLSNLFLYYIRLVISNRIRNEYRIESGLFWLGAISQMGSLAGAIPMYLLINVFDVFESRVACQNYCF